jgi:hypothetical protein
MPGTLVKTSRDGYKKVEVLGQGTIQNPGHSDRSENRLYTCTKANYPEITEDLFITGCHSILVNNLTDKQREDTIKHLGRIFVTDRKYRLMACLDDRAEPFASEGIYTIYHIALEHTDPKMNYGVYANGLLVETCSKRYLKETIIHPVGNIIYNEIYIYLWMICLYHVFLILIVLVNLYLLLRFLPYLQNPNLGYTNLGYTNPNLGI